MIKNVNNSYENVQVKLDNNEFVACHFKNCRLEFGGTGPVSMSNCNFDNISWEFSGPAENTLRFLKGLYHGMGEGGRQLVEATFDDIRKDGV